MSLSFKKQGKKAGKTTKLEEDKNAWLNSTYDPGFDLGYQNKAKPTAIKVITGTNAEIEYGPHIRQSSPFTN